MPFSELLTPKTEVQGSKTEVHDGRKRKVLTAIPPSIRTSFPQWRYVFEIRGRYRIRAESGRNNRQVTFTKGNKIMHLTEIVNNLDFDAVGSTNLKTLDTTKKLLNEKLSVLIFADILKNYRQEAEAATEIQTSLREMVSVPRGLHYTEYFHSIYTGGKTAFSVTKNKTKYVPQINLERMCIDFDELLSGKHQDGSTRYFKFPKVLNIHSGGEFKEISFFDATPKMDIPEDKRIDELLKHFQIDAGVFSPFKLESGLRPIQFPVRLEDALYADLASFTKFQIELEDWFSSGFPRAFNVFNLEPDSKCGEIGCFYKDCRFRLWRYKGKITEDRFCFPKPIFYKPLGPMTYDIHAYRALPQIFFYRLFLNSDRCGLREALIPCIYVFQERKSVGSKTEKPPASQDPCHVFMTGLPNMERLPLWNIDRIMSSSTDTVVLCGCIQDAEALQRANEDIENVAFTGHIGDHLDIVDWLPLAGKNIVFLISPHNGVSLEDDYEKTSNIHKYLTETMKLEFPEVAFVQRQVSFPGDTSTIATPEALASVYYHNRPKVDSESVLQMNESEFHMMLAKIQKMRIPFWAKEVVPQPPKSRVDDFIVRGFLYKGETTLLAGKSGSKKTHFALTLGRYVVAGDKPFLRDRFWTRAKPEDFPKKVVYWCFDDVSEREIKQQDALYKKGLSKEFADNFFIESAPATLIGNFETKAIKKALERYKYEGFSGLPVSLLIIDHLTALKGDDNRAEALSILSKFKREAMPDLAILVLHHCGQRGILSKTGVTMGPRINVTMEKVGNIFKLAYDDSTNISLADVEKEKFSFVYDGLGVEVYEPKYNSEEMFKHIVNYYRNEDYMHYKDDEIGILMGYNGETVRKKLKEKKKKKAGTDSPTTADDEQNVDIQSKDEEAVQESSEPHLEQ